MPSALHRVEGASKLLEEASGMLKEDPYSGPARFVKLKLIFIFFFSNKII